MELALSTSPWIGAAMLVLLLFLAPKVAKALATLALVGGLAFGGAVWMGYAPEDVRSAVANVLQGATQEAGLCEQAPAPVAELPAPATRATDAPSPTTPVAPELLAAR